MGRGLGSRAPRLNNWVLPWGLGEWLRFAMHAVLRMWAFLAVEATPVPHETRGHGSVCGGGKRAAGGRALPGRAVVQGHEETGMLGRRCVCAFIRMIS